MRLQLVLGTILNCNLYRKNCSKNCNFFLVRRTSTNRRRPATIFRQLDKVSSRALPSWCRCAASHDSMTHNMHNIIIILCTIILSLLCEISRTQLLTVTLIIFLFCRALHQRLSFSPRNAQGPRTYLF